MTTGPMAQVGCARACSTVTAASSSRRRPRNGPPEAVSTSRATSSPRPPRRHWASAECSESTGTIWPGRAAAVTSGPPATSDSLFASASRAPVASAASVGPRPREPVIPLSTVSAGVVAVSSVAASGPASTSTPGSSRRSAAAAPGSATATRRTPCATACAASSATSVPPAARPTTRNRCGRRRDHVQRLRADRAGRAEDDDAAGPVGDRCVGDRFGGGHRGHSARAVRRCGTTGPARGCRWNR